MRSDKDDRTLLMVERLLLLLPVAAVASVAYFFVELTTPQPLPLWAAIPLGLLLGALALVFAVATSGTDFMDLIVSSVGILILSFIIGPLFARAKEHRARHKHHAPHARIQAPTKTPQH